MKRSFALILIPVLLIANFLPAQSNNKVANKNIIYVSPVPNSQMNSPLTNIIVRSDNKLNRQTVENNSITVTGSKSGIHNGNIILGDDGRTIIFNPYQKFSAGEFVSVYLKVGVEDLGGSQIGGCDFDFTVSSQNLNTKQEARAQFQNEIDSLNIDKKSRFIPSTEGLRKINKAELNLPADFPQLYVSTSLNPSPGYIFMSNINTSDFNPSTQNQESHYLMIIDSLGRPFFYKKMDGRCLDFKLQPNGMLTYFYNDKDRFFEMNDEFSIVDTFYCKGYPTNGHELQLLPNGHYLIIGDDREKIDMSKIVAGGDTSAIVTGIIIQELDKDKNVVFQWRTWDHFKITDATDDIDLTAHTIDYVHTNAIELDSDGNLLISSRHLDEITKIDKQTGDVIWRLGGKNNQFQFVNDIVGFSHQHDIRRLPNDNITLFDDGNLHWSQLPSRAVEYKLDEHNFTAELVWQFKNTPDELSLAMGDVQRLDDGNTVIGWGTGSPAVTEITQQGVKTFELALPANKMNYRAFKFKLNNVFYGNFIPSLNLPTNEGEIADTMITLSWNENKFAQSFHLQLATDSVFANIIYQDSGLVNTSITFDSLEDGIKYYWRVLSDNNTDSVGGYAGYSNPFTFTTLLKSPSNLNVKTTMTANSLEWENNSSNADSVIIERKGGSDTLSYKVIATISGRTNSFVDKNPDAINVVSNLYTYRVKSVNKYIASNYTYSPEITWNAPIYSGKGYIPKTYTLQHNYPNPFNPSTYIVYDIPTDGTVVLKVYDILGREITTLVNEYKKAGRYKVQFSGNNLASGIYIYNLSSGNFIQTRKMILQK